MAIWRHSRSGKFERATAPFNRDASRWAILACPGPSLSEVDASLLNGPNRTVFAINTAYPTIRPDIWMGMDIPDCFDAALPEDSFLKIYQPAHKNDSRVRNGHNILIPDFLPGTEFSFDPVRHEDEISLFYKKDTFRSCLHLIVLLGYRKIALVGCDMGHDRAHYCHGTVLSEEAAASNLRLYRTQVQWLKWFHDSARDHGIQIENCAEKTPLRQFMGWKPIDDILSSASSPVKTAVFPHCRDIAKFTVSGDGPLLIEGMRGLGDNIYQRPIIQSLAEGKRHVFLATPWPQIYQGIKNLSFVSPNETGLRTQDLNVKKNRNVYTCRPEGQWRQLRYHALQSQGVPLYVGLSVSAGTCSANYRINWEDRKSEEGNRIALIRPVTFRKEWPARSRNCDPRYIQQSASYLKSRGYETWLVADIDPPHEVLEGDALQDIDIDRSKGQLALDEILSLVSRAAIVISPVGFMVPMCMALSTPAVIIHGGAGGWNHPNIVDAPCGVPCRHVMPDNYCICKSHDCPNCDQTIDPKRIEQAIDEALQPR